MSQTATLQKNPEENKQPYVVEKSLKRTLQYNQNWLVFIGGSPGSGKSYAMLRLFEKLYLAQGKNPLNYIHHIVFTVKDFLELLNSGNLQPGDVILFDEVGVEVNSRDWQSLTNKAFNYVAQTMRHLNLTVLFTAPSFDFVDKSVRMLFHAYYETLKIVKDQKICRCKYKEIQFNPQTGKMYFKYPRLFIEGEVCILDRIEFEIPEVKLRHTYDDKQKRYKNGLNRELLEEVDAYMKKEAEKIKGFDYNKVVKNIVDNPKPFLKTYNQRTFISVDLIREKYNVGLSKGKKIKAMAEKRLKMK